MTWATPKVNWAVGDAIAYTDLNRIEENISANRDANFRKPQGFGYALDDNATYDGVITMSAGSCYSENGIPIRSDSLFSKNLFTWAQGNGATIGGVASAVTVAAYTWYYVFVIMDPTTGNVDFMIDNDAGGPNVTHGTYTEKRYVAAFKTAAAGANGSFNMMEMYSIGEYTYMNPTYIDANGSVHNNSVANNNTYQLVTLSYPTSGAPLPLLDVRAHLNVISKTALSPRPAPAFGLISAYQSAFTIPSPFVNGTGLPRGEYCHYFLNEIYANAYVDIVVPASNQIYVGMYETPSGDPSSAVDIRAMGFHYERLQ